MALLRGGLIRGLILAFIALICGAGWVVTHRASPEQVRAALIVAISEQFENVRVEVGSARLRFFGGVTVSDLKLYREGEAEPFFMAPSAVIYHEKQTLHRGRMEIRKIEFEEPTLRLIRNEEGVWNVAGLVRPREESSEQLTVPTVVVRDAQLLLEDKQEGGLPRVLVSDLRLTLVNDPTLILNSEIRAIIAPVPADGSPSPFQIPVFAKVRFERLTSVVDARLEITELDFGPALAPAVARVNPDWYEYAEQFTANLGIKIDAHWEPGTMPLFNARVDVRNGTFEESRLPWPVENIATTVLLNNARVAIDQGSGTLGPAKLEFSLETRELQELLDAAGAEEEGQDQGLHQFLERLNLNVVGLQIDDELFDHLPPEAEELQTMLQPKGGVDLTVRFERLPGGWKREIDLRPRALGVVYEKFRYPLEDLAGQVVHVLESDGTDEFRIRLTGSTGQKNGLPPDGRRISISGTISGEGPDPMIRLRVAGTDLPVDDRLFEALDEDTATILKKLRAKGRGDFVADIHQELGVNRCENTFRIRVYEGKVSYTHFPYALSSIRGEIVIRAEAIDPTRPLRPGLPIEPEKDTVVVELHRFQAKHGDGTIWLSGTHEPVPNSQNRKLKLRVQGLECPIDNDLRESLISVQLGEVWHALNPSGKVTFGLDMGVLDRSTCSDQPTIERLTSEEPPFDPVTDLTLALNLSGPSIQSAWFPYRLDQVGGVVRYEAGKLELARIRAQRDESRWTLDAGEVRLAPSGEIWANLGGLAASPVPLDPEFRQALPSSLQLAFNELNPKGNFGVSLGHLVVKVPATEEPVVARGQAEGIESPGVEDTPNDTVIYWNGELRLNGASVDLGMPFEEVFGVLASTGRYEGDHFGSIVGNAWIDQGTIANQPLETVKLSYRIRPQQAVPDEPGKFQPPVLEIPDMVGRLYGGTVGGEARVELTEPVKYRVWLTAADVMLDELAKGLGVASEAEVSGRAQGKLVLENRPDPISGEYVLHGAGQLDVPQGRMYNLPLLLPMLKLLKLQAPDQTAFEEAHASFDLVGNRIHVSQLDLIGTAVSLGGSGDLDTSAENVRFEFYTVWSQAMKRWLTTPGGADLAAVLSGNLFKIEMVKENGEMQYKPQMLPVVTDPFRAVAERLRDRIAGEAPARPLVIRPTVRARVGD